MPPEAGASFPRTCHPAANAILWQQILPRTAIGKAVMIMWTMKRILFAAVSLLPVSAALAQAHARGECFDALVTARIIRQIPSPLPNCSSNCIIVAWPWRLDVDVERVAKGVSPTGPQTLLALQHSYFTQDQKRIRAWLRRHSGGGFNIVKLEDGVDLAPCPAGSKPARPYLRTDTPSLSEFVSV
jgi:hypothetical protein